MSRAPSPPHLKAFPSVSCQALFIVETILPLQVNFLVINPINMALPTPWRVAIKPLNLGSWLHDLPKGSRKIIPKFRGDGKVTLEEHIDAFFVAFSILGVQHEDIVIRLFVESLTDDANEWFCHLPNATIDT